MNHKILFFLSLFVIAVGITGIVMQKKEPVTDDNVPAVYHGGTKKVIAIAETLREIKPHQILNAGDYQIRTLEIDEASQDIRDISLLGTNNLNGYLVLNHLPANSAILPDRVEAPGSQTFVLHSLKENEMPYSYRVRAQDESLLTSLAVGDEVTLYIRLIENEKGQIINAGALSEMSAAPNSANSNYAISRICGPLSIIEIKKDKYQGEKRGYEHDETVGSIVLRASREQLADLRVAEKAGEILLFPTDSEKEGDKKLSMNEVLKQFRAVKQLRGDQ